MTTVRLGNIMEKKLEVISQLEQTSKSEIIKNALSEYFEHHREQTNPYKLGEDLFGLYGSGVSDNSVRYKEKLKVKLNEKHTH